MIHDSKNVEFHLQRKFPGQGKPIDVAPYVHLNKEVKKISYNLTDSSTGIRIECDDSTIYNAHHLICTVSLGVLKERHLSLFDPFLPQKKVDSIECLSFGVVDKIILEFDHPFWPADWMGCNIYWSVEQLKLIREKEETRWVEAVIGFYPVDNQPNVLFGWISGANARKMEGLPTEKISECSIMLLKMLFKDFNVPDEPKKCRT